MREVPMTKQKSVIDLMVFGHVPQSESDNPFRVNDKDKLKNNP